MALEREINVDHLEIDGTEITATASEINALDGLTASYDELNILDGVTATATEINYLDIATLGTGAASKAVVLDAGEDYTWPTAGRLTYGGTAITATGAEVNYLDIATLGTGAASKAVVLDAGEDYTWPATGILTYGGGAINATGAEITRACDLSARLVSLTATASITEAAHEDRDMYITGTALATYTLPEATGSGGRYRFIIGEVNTNNTVITTADATNCSFYGSVNILDKDAAAQAAYAPAATDELITLNGTTTGGQIGDFIEVLDIATDKWMVFGQLTVPTGSNPATPFSGA
jgi:hypothetical protein